MHLFNFIAVKNNKKLTIIDNDSHLQIKKSIFEWQSSLVFYQKNL